MTTTAAVMYAPSPFVNMYGTPYFAGGTADQSQLQHAMPSMAPAMSPQQVVFLPQPANMLPTHPFQPYFVPVMSYPMPTGAPGMPLAPQPVFPQFALPVPSAHDATSMNMATAAIKLQQAPAPAMSVRVGAPREASDKDSHVSSEEAHAQHQLGGAKLRGVPAGNPPPTRSIIGALRFSECRQKRPVVPVAIPQAPKGEREARQLVVNYLAAEITSQHLAQLFSQFGSVEGCRVITDTTTNVSKGFAFVYMGSQEEALHVIASASGRVLLSKRIKVAFADPQVPLASFKSAAEAPFSPLDASSTTTPTSASRGDARRQ